MQPQQQKPQIQQNPQSEANQAGTKQSKILLYNWQALRIFLPYLKLSDLLSTLTISKQWQFYLSQYFKQFVLPQKYSNCSFADVWANLRTVYDRKLVVYQIEGKDKDKEVDNHEKNTKKSLAESVIRKEIYLPFICKSVQVANHVTKIQVIEGDTYIIKNKKLKSIQKKDWLELNQQNQKIWKVPKKFNKVYCIANYLYLIRDNQITRYSTTAQSIFQDESFLDFSLSVDYFVASNSACVVVTGIMAQKTQHQKNKNDKGIQYHFFTHKQFKPKKISFPADIHIEHPQSDIMLDYGSHGFVISSEGKLYEVDFNQSQNQKQKQKKIQKQQNNGDNFKLVEVKELKGKEIRKMQSGARHYFVFQRKNRPLKSWTNAQVLKWAQKQGFDAYLKIFSVEKVTGQKLLNMSKSYMQDVLGITSTLTQQKINLLIQQYNRTQTKYQDFNIYAWGKNDKGQLCMNPSANINSNNPIKLKLPEQFELLTCFGDHTLIINHKTKQVQINTIQQGKLKFQTISRDKIWSVSGNRQTIMLCQSVSKKRIPQSMSEQPIHNKKQKLRTAKNIIDQIQWDENFSSHQKQFTVGYNNRFQGTLQFAFEDFLKSDVKQNSILYFKRNGKLVWDKKSRLDIL